MCKKIFALILMLLCAITLIGCGTGEVKIESISVLETSVPESVSTTQVSQKINDIVIEVSKSNGTKEQVNLTQSMLSTEDLNKLSTPGTHTITVKYEGFETTLTIVVVENYSVKVLYPDNTPVTSGVTVQWCTGNNCFLPVAVNKEGIAEIKLEDGEYYIHIDGIPAGYTYDPNAYTTSAKNKYVEIKLITLSNISSGEGTADAPYVLSDGAYTLTFEEATRSGMKYYSFTPSESGTYNIISMAMDKLALNEIDPYIGFLGTSNDLSKIDVSGNQESNININFKHAFEAEAGVTYTFIIFVSKATSFPAKFDILITK